LTITRNQRRALRALIAVLSAIGAGTLAFPDFVPVPWAHAMQQANNWIVGVFLLVNPFLDIGAGDAKGDTAEDAT
jgi:hypothetical protein